MQTLKLPSTQFTQPTFQYVSILKTLKSLFQQPEFKKIYVCTSGIYKDFCCGRVAKNFPLYSEKNSIEIQLGVDDFDPWDAIKSKSGIHKLNAVYFIINNMPKEYLSTTNNIFLVSLCETINLNPFDFDYIGQLIVQEISELENIGIVIDNNCIIKGTLVHIASDNLGANNALGFVESVIFAASVKYPKKKVVML